MADELATLAGWLAEGVHADIRASRTVTTYSPELDDDGAKPGTVRKLHKCAICELPVAQRFEDECAVLNGKLVLSHVDPVYVPQWGPVCGAASVAGTVLSLAKWHGLDSPSLRSECTVTSVQDCYSEKLNVPNVYKTTAAVGNQTLKKCAMLLRFPSLAGWQCVATDFGCHLVTDPTLKQEEEWRKLKNTMATGGRIVFHSRNHYNRVFGWREVWDTAPDSSSSSDSASLPLVSAPVSAPVAVLGESTAACNKVACMPGAAKKDTDDSSSNIISPMSDGSSTPSVIDASSEGDQENMPAAAAPAKPARRPFLVRKSVRSGVVGLAAPTLAKATTAVATTATSATNTATVAPPPAPTATGPTDLSSSGARLVSRQILMAKKGQRPQHWVTWEAIAHDLRTHPGHRLMEIRLVNTARE